MIVSGDNIKIECTILSDGSPYSLSQATNVTFEVWQYGYFVFTVDASNINVALSTVTANIPTEQSSLLDDAGMMVKISCTLTDSEQSSGENKVTFIIENPSVQAIGGTATIFNLPVSAASFNGVAAAKGVFTAKLTIKAVFSGVAAAKANFRGRSLILGVWNGLAAAKAAITGKLTTFGAFHGIAATKASITGTAEFNKAASAFLWLETDSNVSLSSGDLISGGQVDGWDDKSNNGHTFSQNQGSKQLDYIPNGFGSHPVIGTTGFASQSKKLVTDASKSTWNFLHDGTTPYVIFLIKQGYNGSAYSDADIATVYNANAGSGPGFIAYRANRTYIKSAAARKGAAGDDGNAGFKLFTTGFRDDGVGNKEVFSQVYGGTESTDDMSSFVFDSSDSFKDLHIGGRNGGSSRSAEVAIVLVKNPSATEITEWTNYLTTKYGIS